MHDLTKAHNLNGKDINGQEVNGQNINNQDSTARDNNNQRIDTEEIQVWDPLVRLFHWSLVLTFTVAYFTGEEGSDLHIYSGYIVGGLVAFRLLWGFIGTRYARFSDFMHSPRTVLDYTKSLFTASSKHKHYIGHNPAGGAMIIALLLSLVVVTYSGLKVYAIEEGAGPLAQSTAISFIKPAYANDDVYEDGEDEEEFWEEIHEASANLVLFLVLLHIAGVIVSARLHHENLVKAMLTGKKKIS